MNSLESEELLRVAQLLLDLASKGPGDTGQQKFELRRPPSSTDMGSLCERARKEIRARHLREQFLPRDLFAEGGWNVLLDLFVAETERKHVSITDACIASNLPATTALRHIHLLVERGLIQRSKDPGDGRRELLRLTCEGLDMMSATLEAMAALDSPKGTKGGPS